MGIIDGKVNPNFEFAAAHVKSPPFRSKANLECDTKKKVDQKKNELKDLSNKFKELKSLIYGYRDKKESEIKELNVNHQNFKNEIQANQEKYEKLIDEAADEISSFVEKAKLENISQ